MNESTCRRCSECEGMSHHWTPDPMAPDDDNWEPGDYACKHCEQRGDECGECEGTGWGPYIAAYVAGGEIIGPDCEPCKTCKGEGVLPLTDERYAHEMQLSIEER